MPKNNIFYMQGFKFIRGPLVIPSRVAIMLRPITNTLGATITI